jgi:hypothetical protein
VPGPRAALHGTLAAIGITVVASACGLGLGGQSWSAPPGEPTTDDAAADAEPDATANSMRISNVLPDAAEDFAASAPGDEVDDSLAMIASDAALDPFTDAALASGAQDGSSVTDASVDPTCAKLATCCPVLAFVSAPLLSSCDTTVSSNSGSACASFISGFQSFGLCI